MTTTEQPTRGRDLRRTLVLAGIVVVALNLRTAITAVGPLVPTIRADLGVDNVAMGAIGTIPVLMFGVVAAITPLLSRRFGVGRSLAASMLLLAGAILVRSAGGYLALATGTALLGVAIAVGNVLVPALIKSVFPDRVGGLTSLYGTLMVIAASVSAGIAVPLGNRTSWEFSLGVWAVPAVVGALVVGASVWVDHRSTSSDDRATEVAERRADRGVPAGALHRSSLAWQVTAFMGLQSVLFYVVLAWLPDVLIERGMSDAAAGAMLSVLNVGGLVGVLVAPAWSGRHPDQRWFGATSGALAAIGLALLLVPGTGLAAVASFVFGLGAGSTVGLALMFMSLRTATARGAAALSGMAQTWGYLVSAVGPIGWGALRDASSSWTPPLVALLVVAVATAVAGWAAGREAELDVTALTAARHG